jgi:hypothetical protein
MVKEIERNGIKYLVLERDERNHVYEFAILKNLEKDEDRTVIPKEEVLAVIAEFTNEAHIEHRFSIRWGWGSIFFRIKKNSFGDDVKVAYYTPCEKQFIEYCEKRGWKVYLGEDLYYEPSYSYAIDIPTHIIYCYLWKEVWIIHTSCSERFAKKLEEELRKDPELVKQLLNDTKIKEVYTVNVNSDYGYATFETLMRMVERDEGCRKIDIPEDIAKKICKLTA